MEKQREREVLVNWAHKHWICCFCSVVRTYQHLPALSFAPSSASVHRFLSASRGVHCTTASPSACEICTTITCLSGHGLTEDVHAKGVCSCSAQSPSSMRPTASKGQSQLRCYWLVSVGQYTLMQCWLLQDEDWNILPIQYLTTRLNIWIPMLHCSFFSHETIPNITSHIWPTCWPITNHEGGAAPHSQQVWDWMQKLLAWAATLLTSVVCLGIYWQ